MRSNFEVSPKAVVHLPLAQYHRAQDSRLFLQLLVTTVAIVGEFLPLYIYIYIRLCFFVFRLVSTLIGSASVYKLIL